MQTRIIVPLKRFKFDVFIIIAIFLLSYEFFYSAILSIFIYSSQHLFLALLVPYLLYLITRYCICRVFSDSLNASDILPLVKKTSDAKENNLGINDHLKNFTVIISFISFFNILINLASLPNEYKEILDKNTKPSAWIVDVIFENGRYRLSHVYLNRNPDYYIGVGFINTVNPQKFNLIYPYPDKITKRNEKIEKSYLFFNDNIENLKNGKIVLFSYNANKQKFFDNYHNIKKYSGILIKDIDVDILNEKPGLELIKVDNKIK